MSTFTMAPERVRVMRSVHPAWRWSVYCGACPSTEGSGIESLFWGRGFGGTDDWSQAIAFADHHARSHRRCGECGQIKPPTEETP